MIGIYGGTFDPIHFGHVRMALFVLQRLRLRALHMIPCAQPVHRNIPQASAEQRYKMLQLALLPFPSLIADRVEIDRQGPSYTIDTVEYFSRRSNEPRCLIVGYDAFIGFSTWHEWQRIAELAHIVVLRRDHDAPVRDADFAPALQDLLASRAVAESCVPAQWRHAQRNQIVFLENPKWLESSSAIRAAIAGGNSVRHRIPLPVADYIEDNRLYK